MEKEKLIEKTMGSGKEKLTIFVYENDSASFDEVINRCICIQAEKQADAILKEKLSKGITKLLNYIEK